MAQATVHGTEIEWTHMPGYKGETWNPIRGCTRVSEGCRNCYAERIAARFSEPGQPFEGVAKMTASGPRWTGRIELVKDKLHQPMRWKQPRMVFVNSMSDLFHPDVPDWFIARVFRTISWCVDRHIFLILTKRPERALEWFKRVKLWQGFYQLGNGYGATDDQMVVSDETIGWPLPNVWLGVSVEHQQAADERIPYLLQTPAAVRFVSCEPLLGPVDLTRVDGGVLDPTFRGLKIDVLRGGRQSETPWHLNWVIVGGESGPGARPMHPEWVRRLRDQCQEAGVAFFFKQWGEWAPHDGCWDEPHAKAIIAEDGEVREPFDGWGLDWDRGWQFMVRVGKKRAGAELDGREWREFPRV